MSNNNEDNSMKILNGLLNDDNKTVPEPEPEIDKAIEILDNSVSESKETESQTKTYVFDKETLTMTDCYLPAIEPSKNYDPLVYHIFEATSYKEAQEILQIIVKEKQEEKTAYREMKEKRINEKKEAKAKFNKTETKSKEENNLKISNTKDINPTVANFYLEFSFDETRLEIFRYILQKLKVVMGGDILNIVIDETKGLYFFQMMDSGSIAVGLDIPKTHFNNFYFHDPKYEKIETIRQISIDYTVLLNALKRIPVNKSNHIKFFTTVTKPTLTVSYRSGSNSITKRIPIMSEEKEYDEALSNRAKSIPLDITYKFKDQEEFNELKEAYYQWTPNSRNSEKHVMIQTEPDEYGDGQLMLFSERNSNFDRENEWETIVSTDITTSNDSECEQGFAYYDFDVVQAMLFPFNTKNSLKSHTETLLQYGENKPMRVIHKFMNDIIVTCLVAPLDQTDEFEDD